MTTQQTELNDKGLHIGRMTDPKESMQIFKRPGLSLMLLENVGQTDLFSDQVIRKASAHVVSKSMGNLILFQGDIESSRNALLKALYKDNSLDPELYGFYEHTVKVMEYFAEMNPGRKLRFYFSSRTDTEPSPHFDKAFSMNLSYSFSGKGTFGYPGIDINELEKFYNLRTGQIYSDFKNFSGLKSLDAVMELLRNPLEFPKHTLGIFNGNFCHTTPFFLKSDNQERLEASNRLVLLGDAAHLEP